MRHYPEGEQELIRLITKNAVLIVTPSHRVMVKRKSGPQALQAGALTRDDEVFVGNYEVEKLQVAETFRATVQVIDVTFDPDLAVEAIHPVAILSKGHGFHKTRRSKKRSNREPMDDLISIPNTDDGFI